jgi:PPOX class probable FMN-dependent enzyme
MESSNGTITSVEQLREIYDPPFERSLRKQLDHIDAVSRRFIAASPFLILASSGPYGIDCSPRGDHPGFVRVANDKTLLIPDRRGNNRLDSLQNIVENSAVGLIFLVPGVNDTFRVNGRAHLSTDPQLLDQFAVSGKAPKAVLVVTVDEAFVHCPRAFVRADLWNPAKFAPRGEVPTIGDMLEAHTAGFVNAAAYDEEAKVVVPKTLY